MPARDIYHDTVRNALEKDVWTITDDPLHLELGDKNLFVDLGAQPVLAAEKSQQKIAIEIKSFLGPSEMRDLQQAIGQFTMYRLALSLSKPEYMLYLAVPQYVVERVFRDLLGQLLLETATVRVIGFDPIEETITAWI